MHVVDHESGRHQLTLSENLLFLEQCEYRLVERAYEIETLLYRLFGTLAVFVGGEKIIDSPGIFCLQCIYSLLGTGKIFLVEVVGDLDKLVVPDIAEKTTMFLPREATSEVTSFMRWADPTEVPPNFKTFIR